MASERSRPLVNYGQMFELINLLLVCCSLTTSAQKPSPRVKFWNPANLIDKYVFLVRAFFAVPHDAMLGFIMRIDTWRTCRNRKCGCVWCRAHENVTGNPASNLAQRAQNYARPEGPDTTALVCHGVNRSLLLSPSPVIFTSFAGNPTSSL